MTDQNWKKYDQTQAYNERWDPQRNIGSHVHYVDTQANNTALDVHLNACEGTYS